MRRKAGWILMTAGLVFFAGCNGASNPASSGPSDLSDEEEISQIIEEEMSDYFNSDVVNDEPEDGSMMKTAEEIETDRWRRIVANRSLEMNIQFPGDGSAEVTAVRYVEGTLVLVDEIDSVTTTIYEKSFADTITRYALFRRNAAPDPRPPYRRWYLEAVSFCDIVSTPVNSVEILSVTVENLSSGYTRIYEDPAALLDRETEIPEFNPGDPVELTVEANGAGLLGFLHTRSNRLEMTDNGDGTYSGIYTTPSTPGAFSAAVDLLTEDTIFDDVADYDGNAWGIVYRVQ